MKISMHYLDVKKKTLARHTGFRPNRLGLEGRTSSGHPEGRRWCRLFPSASL